MNTTAKQNTKVSGSDSGATATPEKQEPASPTIMDEPTQTEAPAPTPAPAVQRMSHKDHMIWMRDTSMQIRQHYEEKTGSKLSKPISNKLFARDMDVWFSARQKEQANAADVSAIDPQPVDPSAIGKEEGGGE
jgi:hypothetical protein